jgi:hypothetical protein
VGIVTVRRRKRRSTVAAGRSQPSSGAVEETGESPGENADGALEISAASAAPDSLEAGEIAHDTSAADQTVDGSAAGAGADGGPLARLASASQRLERLTQTGAPAVATTDATTPAAVGEAGRAVDVDVPQASADAATAGSQAAEVEVRGELEPGSTDAPSTESSASTATEAREVATPEAEHGASSDESGVS